MAVHGRPGFRIYIRVWAGGRKDAELSALRSDLQKQLAQFEQSKAQEAAAHKSELDRLREDNAALREGIHQLREDAQQRQAQAQAVQAYAVVAQAQQQEQSLQLIALAQQREACINNLRAIDKAKQNWAARRFSSFSVNSFSSGLVSPQQLGQQTLDERNRISDSVPPVGEIMSYFGGSVFPTCPAGGVYSINAVKAPPTCSIPGHVLPE